MVPVPAITAVSKSTVHVGDTIVITGTGFNALAADNIVAIASNSLQVAQASATQLVVVVPATAQSGQLTVGFTGGQPAVWPQNILIIGGTQPYITSVVPAQVFTGDTVVVRGGNFTVPSNTDDIVVDGIAFTILNVSDSVIRAVVPEMAHTGQLTVSANGSVSLPLQFIVKRPAPLADGRIYWDYAFSNGYGTAATFIFRGTDSAVTYPYGTTVLENDSKSEFTRYSYLQGYNLDPLPNDAQGNVYYVDNVTDNYNYATTEYKIIKVKPGPTGSFTHTVIFDQDFANANYTEYFPVPSDPTVNSYIQDLPDELSVDGNKLYVKLGVSNNYLMADLTAPSPVFTTITGLVPDSASYGAQFGTNYIFYRFCGSDDNYDPDLIAQVKYVQRGSTAAQTIPIPADEKILTTLADNSHGDNILILTQTTDATPQMKIYKFNAATQTLLDLYGPNNWVDAPTNLYGGTTTGLLWAGSHIYYADSRRHTIFPSYTGLYLLNDDGSSQTVLNVYPRLEPASSTGPASPFKFFIGKN
jgi:hypothetical protein